MTTPYSVSDNSPVLPADVNQYKNILEGATGYTDTFVMVATTGTNYVIRLGDAIGTNKLSIQNSASVEKAYIDSNGLLSVTSFSASSGSLILPQSATPSQTAEGSVAWDTDDDVLTVGTGSGTKRLGLTRGAGSSATALNEMVYDTTAAQLNVWNGTSSVPAINVSAITLSGLTKKYKTATQVFTTTTTFADVIAAGSPATMSFTVAANEVWLVNVRLLLSFGGTGGLKLQFTGPAAPTAVTISSLIGNMVLTDGVPSSHDVTRADLSGTAAAFSAVFASYNSSNTSTDSTYASGDGINSRWVDVVAMIANGANAGTVTLQAAQNSSNSTTTLGLGSYMRAERVA